MKILVTGSEGFIGSHLCKELNFLGHEVIGFDLKNGDDLLDRRQIERSVSTGVQVVYHIAAQADINAINSVDDAYLTTESNVLATNNVAYACTKHKVWLIYAATLCVYGNQTNFPVREDSASPKPSELYTHTQLASEPIIKGYGASFGLEYTILRFAAVYGSAPDLVKAVAAICRHPESKGRTINLTEPEAKRLIRSGEAQISWKDGLSKTGLWIQSLQHRKEFQSRLGDENLRNAAV